MAQQVLNLNCLSSTSSPLLQQHRTVSSSKATQCLTWTSLQNQLKCNGNFTCLFSDNGKQDQARKALESALGGKKIEFEKWNTEIKNREEAAVGGTGTGGGGRGSGSGGWFGWGRWFGWFDGNSFWPDAQQAILAVVGIIFMYLIIAKGEVLLALIFNPLLYALRGTRNGITSVTARILRQTSLNNRANLGDSSTKISGSADQYQITILMAEAFQALTEALLLDTYFLILYFLVSSPAFEGKV
ncbi:hypothetical protein ACFE04_030138 [Oxalis oulophora]